MNEEELKKMKDFVVENKENMKDKGKWDKEWDGVKDSNKKWPPKRPLKDEDSDEAKERPAKPGPRQPKPSQGGSRPAKPGSRPPKDDKGGRQPKPGSRPQSFGQRPSRVPSKDPSKPSKPSKLQRPSKIPQGPKRKPNNIFRMIMNIRKTSQMVGHLCTTRSHMLNPNISEQ